jgi:hypothetical protein
MDKFKKYEEFVNESESLEEGTIEGYRYRFTLDGKKYFIDQGKKDKTIFGIRDKEKGGWKVMTRGHLFDPKTNDMDRNSFIEFIQQGIKFFNIRAEADASLVKDSEWAKFFKFEIKKKPGRLTKNYVIKKLQCGKAACKWLSR